MICVSPGRGGGIIQAIKAPLSDICCYADMPQDRSADGWDNLFFSPVVPSRCCQCLPLHLLACQCMPVHSVFARVQPGRAPLHLLVLSKPAATCFSRRLNDHQHGKTGLQRLRAKPVSKKAGKVSQ